MIFNIIINTLLCEILIFLYIYTPKKFYYTKKIKTFVKCLFVAGGLLLINSLNSCSTDGDQSSIEQASNLKSTDKVSETLLGLGVKKINVNDGVIKFETFGDFLYRDKAVNFSNYTIYSSNGVLSTQNSSLYIDRDGDVAYSNSFVQNQKLKNVDFTKEMGQDDLILILAYLELKEDIVDSETESQTSVLGNKTSYAERQSEIASGKFAGGGGGCSFFNIRRACGFGFTQAEADADLWVATANFAAQHMGQGCVSIGGVSHKDAGFAALSIQSFCCP